MEQIRELVKRAVSGPSRDKRIDAYGQLVERYRDMACGYAYSILGDFHLAEDAAQEAFINAFDILNQLQKPEAFPGWFRRIVWSACGRMTRRKTIPAESLDYSAEIQSEAGQPDMLAERNEMRDVVLEAIRNLPDPQREVTTLFYINGYSQNDIADFLEVPVSTIKSRLIASRSQLKERMLNMVEETLHKNAPDERFDKRIVEELLAKPNYLHIEGHPVREVLDLIRKELVEFKFIESDDLVRPPARENEERLTMVFRGENGQILSYETTISAIHAAKGLQPPVHLLVAGRSFRDIPETPLHSKAFHQMDLLCVENNVTEEKCFALLRRVIKAVLGDVNFVSGEGGPLWYSKKYHEVSLKTPDKDILIGWYGILNRDILADLGYDTRVVDGYAVDFGLDRLAMLRCGIDDIRKLCQPPYVC